MDINLNVPGIEKLLDYAASGIGSVAGPMLAPWKAGREAKAQLQTAEGQAEIQRIQAKGHAESMQIIAAAQAEARSKLISPEAVIQGEVTLGDLVTQRVQFQEEKRQANIGSVVAQAVHELGDKEVRNQPVDHDWTARFFSDVQDVSSEDMQQLWARILAGEVERPGSTAIKTLGILKNLDKATASLFRTLCSMSVSTTLDGGDVLDARVPSLGGSAGENALQEYGLNFRNLNVLNEHGLIISDYNSWYDIKASIGLRLPQSQQLLHIPLCHQRKYWILVAMGDGIQGREFKLSGVALTQSGQELYRIAGLAPTAQYTQDLAEFFEENHLKMTEVPSGEPQLTSLTKLWPPSPKQT